MSKYSLTVFSDSGQTARAKYFFPCCTCSYDFSIHAMACYLLPLNFASHRCQSTLI